MSDNNADRVKKIIVSQLNVSEEQVTPEASFIDDLGADSLDQVELVMALEEEFGTEIPEEEAEKLQTVGSVIEYVEKNLSWFFPFFRSALANEILSSSYHDPSSNYRNGGTDLHRQLYW